MIQTPWDDIRTPTSDYNVRRLPESGTISLYWGKDWAGSSLFIVELEGDHAETFRKNRPIIYGIGIDLRRLDGSGVQRLVLTLEDSVNRDIFERLCRSLAIGLRSIDNGEGALNIALNHLKRWKAFLAGRKNGLLSDEEIRGLFAELLFLRALYHEALTKTDALEAWGGPEGLQQDFVFGNTAVEIKALSGRERNSVRISSEDQLESLCDNLFLMIFRLTSGTDRENSLSLNSLVRLIADELVEESALATFWSRLADYGYLEYLPEYDRPQFSAIEKLAYRVTEGFPRLVRSHLPEGIVRVSYEIGLEKITPFRCNESEVWR